MESVVPLGDAQGVQAPQQEASFASSTHPAQLLRELVLSSTTPRALPWQEERSGGSHTSPASPEEGEIPSSLSGFLCLCLPARPKGTKPHIPVSVGDVGAGDFPRVLRSTGGARGQRLGWFPAGAAVPTLFVIIINLNCFGFLPELIREEELWLICSI